MKKLRIFILCLLLIPCMLLTTACSLNNNASTEEDSVYVVSISPSASTEKGTTYIVTYSDESTTSITIENGIDGLDGQSLTISELKVYCKEKGISLDQFIKDHVTIELKVDTIAEASAKALKSTVSIYSSAGAGSGVIYKMENDYSYIVTNYHVVYNTSTKSVSVDNSIFLYGYETSGLPLEEGFSTHGKYGKISAQYVGGALNYDLAVLKVKTSDIKTFQPSACAVNVASSYTVGDTAIAIGNPEAWGTSVTSGNVSVISETIEMTGADNRTPVKLRVIRMDTSVNTGNSGGGLFNIAGELIGIVNAKTTAQDIDNINYALPCDNISKVSDNLIYYHKSTSSIAAVYKLYLGLSYTTENYHSVFTDTATGTEVKLYSDFVVQSVDNKSLAETLGIQVGDKIVGATIKRNGDLFTYEFNNAFECKEFTLTVRPNDTISFKINRDGIESFTSQQKVTENMLTIEA